MKLFLVTLFVGIASAAQLQNTYLPPNHAGTSGGHGSFLQGPSTKQTYNNFGQPNSFSQGSYAQQSQASPSYQQPQQYSSGPVIPILKYENVNNGDGSYHFEYATGNGIMQHEEGHLNNPGSDQSEQVVSGSYSYTGPDGKLYTVNYRADANGFHAEGDHLPTPPPIPEAIQRSLQQNAAAQHSSGGQYDSGAYQGGQGGGGQGAYNQGAYSQNQPQKAYLPPTRQSGSYNANSGYQY